MNIVAIIQARMGSTRLRGKVLTDLGGQTVLARVVSRVRRATLVNSVVVATTTEKNDDPIVYQCDQLEVDAFRGDEYDVLDRYYRAAQSKQATAIVRVTADCPLIDPEVMDKTIRAFVNNQPDYASNTLERTYPRGLDTEVAQFAALERAWRDARDTYQRVHVTPYLYQNPQLFKLLSVKGEENYSQYRWTLDTTEDLEFLHAVFNRLQGQNDVTWRAVVSLLQSEPELVEINNKVSQKSMHEG